MQLNSTNHPTNYSIVNKLSNLFYFGCFGFNGHSVSLNLSLVNIISSVSALLFYYGVWFMTDYNDSHLEKFKKSGLGTHKESPDYYSNWISRQSQSYGTESKIIRISRWCLGCLWGKMPRELRYFWHNSFVHRRVLSIKLTAYSFLAWFIRW